MSRFSGPQRRGAMRAYRLKMRGEAEERQKKYRAAKLNDVIDNVLPPVQGVLDSLK